MRISRLEASNYRTLENVCLRFPTSYTAICGANDSGKTNILRIVRAFMKDDHTFFYIQEDDQKFSVDDDFPKWKQVPASERNVTVSITIVISPDRDTGLYHFIIRQLSLDDKNEPIEFTVSVSTSHEAGQRVSVTLDGTTFDGLQAQEVLQRIRTSNSILFHNSTQPDFRRQFGGGFVQLTELSEETAPILESAQKTVDESLATLVEGHQQELEALLGRLDKKYNVRLSLPAMNFKSLPFQLTLGERGYNVPLNNWGSGTQNRTLILLTLFRAKQISESRASTSKITPVIVIEEPESFLHPAAQAEFGRILVDLAEEFQVQVIATTHSPYLLSIKTPESNVLLQRRADHEQLLETDVVATSGKEWMKPFGLALGLKATEFEPWRDLFMSDSDAILLVEGTTDKEYFTLLRNPAHGRKQLKFKGEIVAYDGKDSLKNSVLLNFIKNRYKRIFITFDLDAQGELDKRLQALGFEPKKHFAPVGINSAGKKNIEGLLPDSVPKAVFSTHEDLVQAAMHGAPKEQKSARNKLKRLQLEEFKTKASPGVTSYGGFYRLVNLINRALGE